MAEIEQIDSVINPAGAEVLNAASNVSITALVSVDGVPEPVKSDVDEQLLVYLPFKQPVRLHTVIVGSAEGCPKTLKLFVNRTSMTFDDVDSYPPTQVVELKAGDYADGVATVTLQFVKFQSVNSLTIFVADNLDGSEVTTLSKLQFRGIPIAATDVSAIKKQPGSD